MARRKPKRQADADDDFEERRVRAEAVIERIKRVASEAAKTLKKSSDLRDEIRRGRKSGGRAPKDGHTR